MYLLQQLGYGMGRVTSLWVASQLANALTMYLWGRLSDQLSNKAILAVALPACFGGLIALPFSAIPHPHALTLPLLYLIHVVMGAASGGIALATGNLGLKLAPHGRGTHYLAVVALAGALASGIAAHEVIVMSLRHWEFLFGLSFLCGGYVLHALSRIDEGVEHSERTVIQELVAEASRSLSQLSPIDGLKSVLLFPIGRLRDRRLHTR